MRPLFHRRVFLPAGLFTTSYNELLNDKDINLIVELIDDAEEAYKIVTTAFKNGKSVISANKKTDRRAFTGAN